MQRTPEGHTGDEVPRLVGGSQPLKLDASAQSTTLASEGSQAGLMCAPQDARGDHNFKLSIYCWETDFQSGNGMSVDHGYS